MKKKFAIVIVAVALVIGGIVGGTLAWLIDDTDPVKNTFTVGDINITLEESENLDLKIVPGKEITKDPEVTVVANSEACWLFVKIEESDNLDTFITYAVAGGWIPLTDINKDGVADDGVYYRQVASSTKDQPFQVLAGNKVIVSDTLTKKEVEEIKTAGNPTLTFTAYAVQSANLTDQNSDNVVDAADAWVLAKPTPAATTAATTTVETPAN